MVKDKKDVMRFMIDQQEVDFTLDAVKNILQLPQATTQKPFIRPAEVNEPYHYLKDDDLILYMFTTEKSIKEEGEGFEESSKPRKTKRIKLTTIRPDPIILVPAYNEIEHNQLTEAQHVSIAIDVSTIEAEAKENVTIVEKAIKSEEVDKMVEGEEKEGEDESYDSYLLSQGDPDTRIEPENHMENLVKMANVVDNDEIDDDQHNEHTDELTQTKVYVSNVPSVSSHAKYLKGVVARIIRGEIQKEKQSTTAEITSRISQGIATTAPQQFEAFLNNYMKTYVLTMQPPASATIPDLQQQLYIKTKDDPQSQADDLDKWKVLQAKFEKTSKPSAFGRQNVFLKINHDDHPDAFVPPEGEKGVKKQKTSRRSKSAKDTN
nr:hypothetical protein [Tanacetum cinerariifolium]